MLERNDISSTLLFNIFLNKKHMKIQDYRDIILIQILVKRAMIDKSRLKIIDTGMGHRVAERPQQQTRVWNLPKFGMTCLLQ